MIVFCFFALLLSATVLDAAERHSLLGRSREEWVLDCLSLAVQGVLIPALQLAGGYFVLARLCPQAQGVLDIPGPVAFALNFFGVDYLYYWNHRALHHPKLWPLHQVHHGTQRFDVLVTSRNTLWTPLFIVYLWVNGVLLYLLRDPRFFALGAALTAGLDLWRHTDFSPKKGGWLERALNPWLTLPVDHRCHHSSEIYDVNFAANFKIWDRIHRTYYTPPLEERVAVGAPVKLSLARKLLWPLSARTGESS